MIISCVGAQLHTSLELACLPCRLQPSKFHFYQPLWTLVGGGFKDVSESVRLTTDVIPQGATWLQTSVTDFNPDSNNVQTSDGQVIHYDYLVVVRGRG